MGRGRIRGPVKRGRPAPGAKTGPVHVTADMLQPWRELFDPEVTSVKDFMESFQIQTKDGGKHGAALAEYRERPAQRKLREAIEGEWAKGHGAQILVLKDRQQGITTAVQGLMFERFMRGGGGRGVVISHKDEATEEMFEKIELLRNQLPPYAYRAIPVPGGEGSFGAYLLNSSARQVRLRLGSHLTASIRVYTAGDKALGRGSDPRWIHISEFPHWDRGKEAIRGMLPAWKDAPGNVLIWESTANGHEQFYEMWVKAVEGKNRYVPLFFSWLEHPEKTLLFSSEMEREAFVSTIGRVKSYGEEAELRLVQLGATPEQLHWRRQEIDDPHINGDLAFFSQEHPAEWADAFQATGGPVFDLQQINTWLPIARMVEDAAPRMRLREVPGGVAFEEDRRGRWTIFEMPTPGEIYCYGSDVASGKEYHADGVTEADYSTCRVIHLISGRTVARYRAHIPPALLAVEVMKASFAYGKCFGYIERNQDGGTTIDRLEDLDIAGWTGEESMLSQRVIVRSEGRKIAGMRRGFKTKRDTKPFLIDTVRGYLREIKTPGPDMTRSPIDFVTLREMSKYTKDSDGRMEASTGHDDLVIDLGLALVARSVLMEDLPKLTPVVVVPPTQDTLELMRRAEEFSQRQSGEIWVPTMENGKMVYKKQRDGGADGVLGRGF